MVGPWYKASPVGGRGWGGGIVNRSGSLLTSPDTVLVVTLASHQALHINSSPYHCETLVVSKETAS